MARGDDSPCRYARLLLGTLWSQASRERVGTALVSVQTAGEDATGNETSALASFLVSRPSICVGPEGINITTLSAHPARIGMVMHSGIHKLSSGVGVALRALLLGPAAARRSGRRWLPFKALMRLRREITLRRGGFLWTGASARLMTHATFMTDH